MKVVVGLGNPGRRYDKTRHNVGFEVLDELARRHNAPAARLKFEAESTEVTIADEKTLLVAPQTYMNLSGRSVGKCVRFFQLPLDDLIVICDDMNLPLGRLRLRPEGSAGGQKGLENTIAQLASQKFSRMRIGIGRPANGIDATGYVLSRFRREEQDVMDQTIQLAADGIETWIREGLEATMNQFNAPPQP